MQTENPLRTRWFVIIRGTDLVFRKRYALNPFTLNLYPLIKAESKTSLKSKQTSEEAQGPVQTDGRKEKGQCPSA